MNTIARFREFPRHCTRVAQRAVLSIVGSNPPLSTKDIYNLIQVEPVAQRQVEPTRGIPPPNPTGPLRSIRYLKKVVLPHLAKEGKVEKFHTKVDSNKTDVWLWRATNKKPKAVPDTSTTDALPAGIADLPPAAVGVGEDWGHLNKRRRRARERKVARDLRLMTRIQDAKREAARQVLEDS